MKKCLLLAPVFFEYEKKIIQALQEKFEVCFINNEEFYFLLMQEWKKHYFFRIISKVLPKLGQYLLIRLNNKFSSYYIKKIENFNNIDLILCIKGDLFPVNVYEFIVRKYKNVKKVLYQWDDIKLLQNIKYFKYFDIFYSYNLIDCNKYKMNYLPIFIQENNYTEIHKERIYDILVVGSAHPERIKYVKKIYKKYRKHYSFYIHLYSKSPSINNKYGFLKNFSLSYEEYMNLLLQSKTVLDCPLKKQKGPTTRFFDSQITKTKVLTTNKKIYKYPFYNNNIHIIKNAEIPFTFINTSYEEFGVKPMNVNQWVTKILEYI